jgi:hypothetical protein
MLAAAGSMTKVLELAASDMAGLSGLGGLVKATPVVVQEGWALSAVAGPLLATLYTWTEKGLGFVTRSTTSAVPPGIRVDAGVSPGTSASTVTVCIPPASAEPPPEPSAAQYAYAVPALIAKDSTPAKAATLTPRARLALIHPMDFISVTLS